MLVGGYFPYEGGSYVGVSGDITFTDVARGATLDLIDSNCATVTYDLQSPFELGGALTSPLARHAGGALTGPGTTGVMTEAPWPRPTWHHQPQHRQPGRSLRLRTGTRLAVTDSERNHHHHHRR